MTEIEKIEYAKSFIDKLANGINPLNDMPVPDEDIVNHVRLSRCFFYVSDILRQVVENGGVKPPKAKKKVSFVITREQLSPFAFSEKPIPISEITRRINALVDQEEMRSLSYTSILKWLTQIGAIYEETDAQGKILRQPSETGKQLGISVEYRQNERGEYRVVVYNRDAQAFLIDNMEAILAQQK